MMRTIKYIVHLYKVIMHGQCITRLCRAGLASANVESWPGGSGVKVGQ